MTPEEKIREEQMDESVPLYGDNCSPKIPAHGPFILKSVSLATMQLTSLPQRWK
jgi:hypothetical protein